MPVLPTIPVWTVAKVFVLFGLGVYIAFAAVVVRQVMLMTETLEVGFEAPIKILGFVHLFFAIFVFIIALTFL